nr:hypothetical protein [Bacteroidota bacterium]
MGLEKKLHNPKTSDNAHIESKEKLRQDLNRRIFELIRQSGLRINEIAELLDANDFLHEKKGKGRSGAVFELDVKKIVEERLKKAEDEKPVFRPPSHTDVVNFPAVLTTGKGRLMEGEGEGLLHDTVERLKYFGELMNTMNLEYELYQSTDSSRTLREHPYYICVIKSKQKIVLINEEKGNTTFVLHGIRDDWKEYVNKEKIFFSELALEGVASRIDWPKKDASETWKANVQRALASRSDETAFKEAWARVSTGEKETTPEEWVTFTKAARLLGKDPTWVRSQM